MPPRLDKARGLERRPMAYQVRHPNIQVQQQTFKKPAPQAPHHYKKVSRPNAFPPAPPPTNTMTSLIANTPPKHLFARDCVCCPVGTTSLTVRGMILKVVFLPGCEKCEHCTCKLVEVLHDEPNPWKRFWDLNGDCGYCHTSGGDVEPENVVKEKKSFEQKIWEAFVYTDGADGADGFIGSTDVGENLDVGAAGATHLNEVTDLGENTGLNVITGDLDGISTLTEDSENDPFATYFTENESVVLSNSEPDDSERWLDCADSDTGTESFKVVDVVVSVGGIKSEKRANQSGGTWLKLKGLYGGYKLKAWGNLFRF
ncbi:hypothetical protein DFP73DRAFT_624749 [Morchella snyderi]|nr:hypothetical protein DFP73DRAFT_624749 [Morchella snyderi]